MHSHVFFLIGYVTVLAYLAINLPISDESVKTNLPMPIDASNTKHRVADIISSMDHEMMTPRQKLTVKDDAVAISAQANSIGERIGDLAIHHSPTEQYIMGPCAQHYQ